MSRLRVFVSRALDLLLRARRDDRLDAEVDLHLALLTDEGLAHGMTPDQARAAARRRVGGVDQVKTRYRDQRGLPVLDALLQDARFGWRVLSRDRGFTVTAVLVLALGIGVNNMMFTILNAHTIRGLPIPDASRVIYVSTRDTAGTDRGLSWPEFADLRDAAVSTALGAFVSGSASLANEHEAPDRVERSYVAAGTLTLLSSARRLPGGDPVREDLEGEVQVRSGRARPDRAGRWSPHDGCRSDRAGVGLPRGR
jgi:hypothetical protein